MTFALAFLIAFIASFIIVRVTVVYAKKLGIVDNPKLRHHPASLHTRVVPRAGGIPIFLAFALSALLFVPVSKNVAGIILGGLVLVVVGILDDKYDIRSSYKFIAQLFAALIVVAFGVGISFITNPLHVFGNFPTVIRLDELRIAFDFLGAHSILVWADLFALFWIVWVINMVNFSSGVDGQLGGISLVTLLVIFAAAVRFYPEDPGQLVVARLAIIGAGATFGFLVHNIHPAKIFPGDSGSYFLGFLIATLAILSGAKVGTALLVMAVPIIDGGFTVVRRIAERKSPFIGDRKHLHHRLLEIGWSARAVSLFYWLLCAILGAIALFLGHNQKLIAGVFVAIIILGVLVWLNMNLQTKDQA